MKMLFSLMIAGMLGLGFCGCSRRNNTPVSAGEQAPVVPAAVPETDPNAPAAAVAEAPIPTKDESGNIPGVEMINSAIGDFFSANGRSPKDINELVMSKYLQKVPPAPPGKKYAIDPTMRQVKLVGL